MKKITVLFVMGFLFTNLSAQRRKILKLEISRLKKDSILLTHNLDSIKTENKKLFHESVKTKEELTYCKRKSYRLSILFRDSTNKLLKKNISLSNSLSTQMSLNTRLIDSITALKPRIFPITDSLQTLRFAHQRGVYIMQGELISASTYDGEFYAEFKYIGHIPKIDEGDDGIWEEGNGIWDGKIILVHEYLNHRFYSPEENPKMAEGFIKAVFDYKDRLGNYRRGPRFLMMLKKHPSQPDCHCCPPDCPEANYGFQVLDYIQLPK